MPAVAQQDLAVDVVEQTRIVCREYEGHLVFAIHLAHQIDDHAAVLRIEIRRRLVGDDEFGIDDQCRGRSPRVAAGPPESLSGRASRKRSKPDIDQRRPRPLARRTLGDALDLQGSITFSNADNTGTRLKFWKTKPILRAEFGQCVVRQAARRLVAEMHLAGGRRIDQSR